MVANVTCNIPADKAIDTYKEVLNGSRKIFPPGFWKGEPGCKRAKAIIKWLLEERLSLSIPDIPRVADKKLFIDNKLCGMLHKVFANSNIQAIMVTYPEVFRITEFRRVPNKYWKGEDGRKHAIAETRYLFEVEMGLTGDDLIDFIRRDLNGETLSDNNLLGMLGIVYKGKGSLSRAVRDAFPELDIDDWDFKNVPQGSWSGKDAGEKAIQKIRREIGKQGIHIEDLPKLVCRKFFNRLGLQRPLKHFHSSPIEATKAAFPELRHLHDWEFRYVPNGFWQGEKGRENARNATRWLVAKLGISLSELPKKTCVKMFKDNKLKTMLERVYGHYAVKAIIDAFPEETYEIWDFQRVPRGFWQDEKGRGNAIAATRDLIDNRLKIPHEELTDKVSLLLFTKNGRRGVLSAFGESPAEAIIAAFPEEGFRREDFRCFHEAARIGKVFEYVLCDIWSEFKQVKGKDYIFNKTPLTGSSNKPDFQFTNKFFHRLFDIREDASLWGDAKVAPRAFFESKTIKYLHSVDYLVVIILLGNEPESEDIQDHLFETQDSPLLDYKELLKEGRLLFYSINRLVPVLKERNRQDLIRDIRTLREQRIPEKYKKWDQESLFPT